jgi:hypothetical protein
MDDVANHQIVMANAQIGCPPQEGSSKLVKPTPHIELRRDCNSHIWYVKRNLRKAARFCSGVARSWLDMRETRSFSAPCLFKKRSLCAVNAEANSERNLYNPPSGLVLSLHLM